MTQHLQKQHSQKQPLQAIAQNLWIANQPLRFLGLSVGTRMTVIRLTNGDLVVISPIELTPELIAELDALGPVRYQIAPNRYHHLFAAPFKQQYPQAQFWAANGLQEKRPDLAIAQIISADAGDIAGEIFYQQFVGIEVPMPGMHPIRESDPLNEVVFYHPESKTLIITDIAFHFGPENSWETRLVGKILGGYQSLQPTLLEKWCLKDRSGVERSIRKVLEWDFDRVIMAHGSIIETNGKSMLKAGYEWLLDGSLD
jgi:hypothetical protein